jgi:hypothetical protein
VAGVGHEDEVEVQLLVESYFMYGPARTGTSMMSGCPATMTALKKLEELLNF